MDVQVVYWIAGGLLAVAALLTLYRVAKGPGGLDRVVATDVMLAIVIGAVAIEEAINRHDTGLPIMLVVSLLAFIGTVAVARFVAARRYGTTSERSFAVNADKEDADG